MLLARRGIEPRSSRLRGECPNQYATSSPYLHDCWPKLQKLPQLWFLNITLVSSSTKITAEKNINIYFLSNNISDITSLNDGEEVDSAFDCFACRLPCLFACSTPVESDCFLFFLSLFGESWLQTSGIRLRLWYREKESGGNLVLQEGQPTMRGRKRCSKHTLVCKNWTKQF